MAKLTEKQKRFCDEYLIDLNATQAAELLGKRYELYVEKVDLTKRELSEDERQTLTACWKKLRRLILPSGTNRR